MSHADLCKLAVRWLTSRQKCTVVLSELVSTAYQTPDAIGWKYANSYLVECKVSRSDFHANANKPSARSGRGVGVHRYFLTPAGLVTAEEVAQKYPLWGLLEVGASGRPKLVLEAGLQESHALSEIAMLTSALRRLKTREFITIVPLTAEEDGGAA